MKKLFILALIAIMASISLAANTRKQIRFVDENGDARTDITSVTVRDAGTATASTLTTDEAGSASITNPMTTTSTNTGLDAGNGIITFCSAASTYDLELTIGGFGLNLYTIPATKKQIMIPFMTGPVVLNDGEALSFGDGKDITISQSAANLLTIGQTVAGTGSVAVGVDDAGLDWTFFGDTTLVNMKWTTASGLLAFTGQVNVATFEGTTVDAVDTILAVADPTVGNQVWTLPDLAAEDTVAAMASTLATNAPEVANSVTGGTNQLIMEGATADDFETIITPTDATADRTITIPDATGSVQLQTAATTAITADTTATITVVPGTDTLYTYTIDTDNEDCTLTFSAGGSAGDRATLIFITDAAGSGDEVMTFEGTLAMSQGTLTLENLVSNRYVIEFISDGTVWNEVSRTTALP